MPSKLSDHQLCQILYTSTGNTVFKKKLIGDAVLEALFTTCDNFRAPFYIPDTFVCRERYAVYSEVLNYKKSGLVDLLKDNMNQVCLLSDSIIRGADGLFCMELTDVKSSIGDWLSYMQTVKFHVSELDDYYLLIAPVMSFIEK
jgi:hypothetical protein